MRDLPAWHQELAAGPEDDLVARLAEAMDREQAEIAMAAAPERDEQGQVKVRTQPVFCLLRIELLESLVQFTQGGGSQDRRLDRAAQDRGRAV